jgi:hypothetical protein
MSALSEDGPPSVSAARLNAYGEALWAVYDLREIWRDIGPRVETVHRVPTPGPQRPLLLRQRQKIQEVLRSVSMSRS